MLGLGRGRIEIGWLGGTGCSGDESSFVSPRPWGSNWGTLWNGRTDKRKEGR